MDEKHAQALLDSNARHIDYPMSQGVIPVVLKRQNDVLNYLLYRISGKIAENGPKEVVFEPSGSKIAVSDDSGPKMTSSESPPAQMDPSEQAVEDFEDQVDLGHQRLAMEFSGKLVKGAGVSEEAAQALKRALCEQFGLPEGDYVILRKEEHQRLLEVFNQFRGLED
jgi:hypothetical protein